MSDRQATFVEACLSGDAGLAEVDRFVERWHLGGDTRPLHEFLGLTPEEYAAWVETPESLRFIVFAHARGICLSEAIKWGKAENLAARADSLDDAESLMEWLRQTDRI